MLGLMVCKDKTNDLIKSDNCMYMLLHIIKLHNFVANLSFYGV